MANQISKHFTGLITFSLLLSLNALAPAAALEPTVVITSVNGSDGNTNIKVVACPESLHVYVPPVTKENGYSNRESLYSEFQYAIFEDDVEILQDGSYGPHVENPLDVGFPPNDEAWIPGELVNLTFTGEAAGFAPTSFDFSVEVIDPTFSQGTGTITDPYLITSADDLSKMRCYFNKNFKLVDDIRLPANWLSIVGPSMFETWIGSLDGNGHDIRGLNLSSIAQENSGLFASIRHGFVKDLKIVSPVVKGSRQVGVLTGKLEYGAKVSGVEITNANVVGTNQVGLLAGRIFEGASILNTKVQGKIQAESSAATITSWDNNEYVYFFYPEEIGGMVGYDGGEGTVHFNNQVEVEITAFDEQNYAAIITNDEIPAVLGTDLDQFGGYVGEALSNSKFTNLDVTADIRTVVSGEISEIGGFAGRTRSEISNSRVDANIHISFVQGIGEYGATDSIEEIGGAIGVAENLGLSFSDVSSRILIDKATAANNDMGIVSSGTLNAEKIGGAGGEWLESTSDLFNRVKTDIRILDASNVSEAAGYVGRFDSDTGLGKSDIFVSGSINVDASDSISKLSGFSNAIDNGLISAARLFAAVEIDISGDQTLEMVDPFAYIEQSETQFVNSSYWDYTLNPMNASVYSSAQPATTLQLKNATFLKSIGLDLINIWKLPSNSYPELRESVYLPNHSDTGANITPNFPTYGPSNLVMPSVVAANKNVVVTGEKLNTVARVALNGQLADYTVKADGTLLISTANLNAGKYRVEISGVSAGTTWTQDLEIVPTISVKLVKGKVLLKLNGLSSKQVSWKVGKNSGKTFVLSNKQTLSVPVKSKAFIKVKVTSEGENLFAKEIITK